MKQFLLDTNVLLHDPKALQVFEDNQVIIPISVLDELDTFKTRPDEQGRNARHVIKILDNLRSEGSLSEGVNFGKSLIRVELNHCDNIPNGLSANKVDNRLISTALGLQVNGKVVVITKDINLRVKCDALGIESQDYNKDKVATDLDSIYSGVKKLDVDSESIDSLYVNGSIKLEVEGNPNQFFVLKNGSQSAITIYKNGILQLCKTPKEIWGITPRNAEQRMALNVLMDPNIKLVSMIGKAGCGKTLLAVAVALQQVFELNTYQRILISRPIFPMGRDIGFLPGNVDEKLGPWMQPIYDNLEFLLGSDYQMLNDYKYKGLIQIEPLTYIRGRSIPNSLMIVDECQNISALEIKTIITRMGEGSKLIIDGDISQCDNTYLDFADNGLSYVVEKFKQYPIAAHITLRKGERSELATLASDIL